MGAVLVAAFAWFCLLEVLLVLAVVQLVIVAPAWMLLRAASRAGWAGDAG